MTNKKRLNEPKSKKKTRLKEKDNKGWLQKKDECETEVKQKNKKKIRELNIK